MESRGLVVLAASVLMALAHFDAAAAASEADSSGLLDLGAVTPHVKGAKPIEGGPIRVLFVAPRFTLRDVVELGQRIEIRHKTVSLWSWDRLAPETAPEQAEAALRAIRESLASDVDVVVLGNLDCSILPQDVLASMAEYVKGGGGLLLANARAPVPEPLGACVTNIESVDSASAITEGVGESMTPEWPTSLDFVASGKTGSGRVVVLAYATGRPKTHFLLPELSDPLHARPEYLDVYFSLIARALRWAAGREPGMSIERIDLARPGTPNEGEIPPGLPDAYVKRIKDSVVLPQFQHCTIRFRQPAQKTYVVEAQVRDPSRGISIIYPKLPRLEKGQDTYGLDLPLGPGRYFLDLWIKQKTAVVEWHPAVMPIEGWPRIEDLAFSKGFLLPNDAVEASLDVPPDMGRPRACTVWLRAIDSLGRLVSEAYETVPPDGGNVRVRLGFADLIANLVKVEVYVADTDRPPVDPWAKDRAAYGFVYLPVRAPRPLQAYSLAVKADAPAEYNARWFLKTLAGYGFDTACTDGSDEARFVLADLGLRPIPMLESPADGGALTAEQERIVEDTVKGFWTIGGACHMVGGTSVPPRGKSENEGLAGLVGFREEMRSKYGDLTALNAAWGSSFSD